MTEPANPPRLIIDCDPGHDDAIALFVAAAHADIVGITTVAGNAPLSATTKNALVVADLAGITAEVHAGAERPLVAPPRHAAHVHGATGLDGPPPRQPSRAATSNDAVGWLIETIRGEEGLWLVPVGPLTNIALALRQAPDLAGRLAGISLMGGSAGPGNCTATAEFNVWADPEAAAVVFGCGVRPLVMCGLNLTHQLFIDDAFVDDLRAITGPAATFCADLLSFYVDRYAAITGRRAAVLHDVCAVLGVVRPSLIETALRPVVVELQGEYTRGMTVVDERPGTTEPANCDVGYLLDSASALAVVRDAITAAPGR